MTGEKKATMVDIPPKASVTRNSRVNALEYAALIVAAATPRMSAVTPGTASALAMLPAFKDVSKDSTDVAGSPASSSAGTTWFLVFDVTRDERMVEKMAAA